MRRYLGGSRRDGAYLGATGAAIALAAAALASAALRRRRPVRLAGATAVVCGASRGLGRAVALELARRGVTRIGICARSRGDLDAVAALLAARGVEVVAEAVDLRDEAAAARFIADVSARLGPIDVLVTNAATITVGPAATLTRDDYDGALASTFYTALHPILAVTPGMRQRGRGCVAIVTSIGARVGIPHLAPYSAAKFASLGLAEALRAELAVDGVNVLAIAPGLMRTGSHVHAAFTGQHEKEYAWFAAGAMAPILSIDAVRAARRIVAAIARGDVEIAFTPEARLAPVLRALMPRVFAEIMAITARLLPRPPDAPGRCAIAAREGVEIDRDAASPVVKALRPRSVRLAREHAQPASVRTVR